MEKAREPHSGHRATPSGQRASNSGRRVSQSNQKISGRLWDALWLPGFFHLWTMLYKIFSYKKIWTILIRIPVRFEPDPGGKNLTLYQPHESRSRRLKTCGSGSTKLNKSKKKTFRPPLKKTTFLSIFLLIQGCKTEGGEERVNFR